MWGPCSIQLWHRSPKFGSTENALTRKMEDHKMRDQTENEAQLSGAAAVCKSSCCSCSCERHATVSSYNSPKSHERSNKTLACYTVFTRCNHRGDRSRDRSPRRSHRVNRHAIVAAIASCKHAITCVSRVLHFPVPSSLPHYNESKSMPVLLFRDVNQ